MWPVTWRAADLSTPAHPQQHTPLEPSTDVCRRPDCTHISPGADDPTQPMPAFPWLSAACQRSWNAAHAVRAEAS